MNHTDSTVISPGGARSGAAGDGGKLTVRTALRVDAVGSGVSGMLLAGAAGLLAGPLGAPSSLLWPVGLFLVGYAVALVYLASRPRISRAAAWAVIGFNAVWVLESIALVVSGWVPLTTLGTAFVLAQAAAVALIADVQVLGVRRAR